MCGATFSLMRSYLNKITTQPWTIIQGDALKVLEGFAPGTFDAVITDPPYASGGRTQAEKNKSTVQKYSSMGENAPPPFDGDSEVLQHEKRASAI